LTVVVDTSVLVAAVNERDERHARALALVEELRQGHHGAVLTTDFVLDEVVTVTLARTGRHERAVEAVDLILPPDPDAAWIALEPVGEAFFRALGLFRHAARRELSFTDWTIVALIREGRADAVVSFDEDFDGLVTRIG
jgi:hypothetical protein